MSGLLVALGAAVGASSRFLVATRLDRELPWGTLLVNVAGSFVLGVLTALSLSESATALLGVGFCGGFTTYSAFAVQAVERGPRVGTAYAALTLLLAPAACALGFWLG
ncbi:fluoride efflux transporter FluC [Nocardioides ferulae]|uniref:fluoride efflux transporter FluC n=1 Tax=Nocardioides ferulae TaxID=2340821 RepID=UPI000EACE798|nr:CrcB family protein [Nocardioides ferulae]